MGRKPKAVPAKPSSGQLLLPKPDGFQDRFHNNTVQVSSNLLRMPSFQLANLCSAPLYPIRPAPSQTSATGQQKLLLPKLPVGVRAPSKIIVVNNSESGQPRVHVINTSRSVTGNSDETRKRMMLTGEMNMARNILPKPEAFVLRPRKTVVLSKAPTATASVQNSPVIPPSKPSLSKPVADESSDSLQHSRKRLVRKITEDASDGFEVYDEDDGEPVRMIPQATVLQIQLPSSLLSASTGRTLLPKPTSTTHQSAPAQVVFANGKCSILPLQPDLAAGNTNPVAFRNVYSLGPAGTDATPDPNDFRHPKRKRRAQTAKDATSFVPPGKGRKPTRTSPEKADGTGKRKVGRPSLVHLPAAELLVRCKSDCLRYAQDGKNLQCLACRTVLTSNGEAAYSKISKHLHADRAHKTAYEAWQAHQAGTPVQPKDGEDLTEEMSGLAKGSRWTAIQKKPPSPAPKKATLSLVHLKRIDIPHVVFFNQGTAASSAVGANDHIHCEMDVVEAAVDGMPAPAKELLYCAGLPPVSDEEFGQSGEDPEE